MARPRKQDQEKRHALSIRLDGITKESLERSAGEACRSLGAEVERRIVATLGLDETGLELVSKIAAEIRLLQYGKSKPWHRDLKLWSAVSEMMRWLPPAENRPDNPKDDEFFLAALEDHDRLTEKRRQKLVELGDLGLLLPEEPFRYMPPAAALSDKSETGQPRLGPFLEGMRLGNSREMAKRTLDTLEPSPACELAYRLLAEVVGLDEQVTAAFDRLRQQLAPFEEAEREGRLIYRSRLQAEAQRRRAEGLAYNYLHSIGSFEWPFAFSA